MCEILINCESELHPVAHSPVDFGTITSYRSINVNTVMNSEKMIQALPVFASVIVTVAMVFWGWKASFLHPNLFLSGRHQRAGVSLKSLCWHRTNGEPDVSFCLVFFDYCSFPVWFFPPQTTAFCSFQIKRVISGSPKVIKMSSPVIQIILQLQTFGPQRWWHRAGPNSFLKCDLTLNSMRFLGQQKVIWTVNHSHTASMGSRWRSSGGGGGSIVIVIDHDRDESTATHFVGFLFSPVEMSDTHTSLSVPLQSPTNTQSYVSKASVENSPQMIFLHTISPTLTVPKGGERKLNKEIKTLTESFSMLSFLLLTQLLWATFQHFLLYYKVWRAVLFFLFFKCNSVSFTELKSGILPFMYQ